MNKLGQFIAAILAGLAGWLLIGYYQIESFTRIGVFFILFLIFGITVEYLIRYFRK